MVSIELGDTVSGDLPQLSSSTLDHPRSRGIVLAWIVLQIHRIIRGSDGCVPTSAIVHAIKSCTVEFGLIQSLIHFIMNST
jgi:hypothetical protein